MASSPPRSTRTSSCPQGGTDVHAIVTVDVHRRRRGGARRGRRRGRDHHRRHLRLDAGRAGSRRPAGGRGGDRPDPRRHLVRRHRRHRPGRPRLPLPQRRVPDGADGAGRPRRGARRAVRQLLAGGGTAMGTWLRLATPAVRARCRGDPAARDPAHRRQEPERVRAVRCRTAIRSRAGRLPVRLPRGRRRLGRPRAARHRDRAARHRRPRSPRPRSSPPTSRRSCATRWAAASPRRSCGSGRRRARRCCSSARSRPQVEDLTGAPART